MTPWLAIVGIGEEGLAGLSPAARALLDGAEILAGGKRHLAFVPDDGRERLAWGSPLEPSIDALLKLRGRRVCLLASGDPFCYGIGATLAPRVPPEEMTVLPAPSAFSLACARLGWPLPDCETLSLHGRSLELLHSFLQPGAKLLLLTSDGATPAEVAKLLVARGYGESRMIAFERMAGEAEKRHEATAAAWRHDRIGALNTLAVECRAAPEAALLPRVPGLPDEAYRHDGQLTKREVRA
ncbi:MAG: precorrin-6y C5,15-methyltransferase (decarboxylating) subunit CbiE, partial [Kiloniellales bacterium]